MEKTHFLSVNFKILNHFGVFPSYYILFLEKDNEIQDGRSYYYLIIILSLFRPGFFWSCGTGAGRTILKGQIVRPKTFLLRSTTSADDVI